MSTDDDKKAKEERKNTLMHAIAYGLGLVAGGAWYLWQEKKDENKKDGEQDADK